MKLQKIQDLQLLLGMVQPLKAKVKLHLSGHADDCKTQTPSIRSFATHSHCKYLDMAYKPILLVFSGTVCALSY